MKSAEFYRTTAWKWFSKYVMLKYANKDYVVKCSTCNTYKTVNDSKMHLGHLLKVFSSGGNTKFATAFDERNVLPQCYRCNVKMGGNELEMLEAVEKTFGKGTYEELKQKSRFPFILDKITLQMIAEEYKNRFKELEKTKGNPWK